MVHQLFILFLSPFFFFLPSCRLQNLGTSQRKFQRTKRANPRRCPVSLLSNFKRRKITANNIVTNHISSVKEKRYYGKKFYYLVSFFPIQFPIIIMQVVISYQKYFTVIKDILQSAFLNNWFIQVIHA